MHFADKMDKLQMIFSLASSQGIKPGFTNQVVTHPPITHTSLIVVEVNRASYGVNQLATTAATMFMEDQP